VKETKTEREKNLFFYRYKRLIREGGEVAERTIDKSMNIYVHEEKKNFFVFYSINIIVECVR